MATQQTLTIQDIEANRIESRFFPVEQHKLELISKVLQKQVDHVEAIKRLAPDRAKNDLLALSGTFHRVYVVDKNTLLQDVAAELLVRRKEISAAQQLERAGHSPKPSLSALTQITVALQKLNEALKEEVALLNALETHLASGEAQDLHALWTRLLAACQREVHELNALHGLHH